MVQQSNQKMRIVCDHRGGPITRCAFTLTLRAGCEHIFQLYKPHLHNKYQMKLRGSAAPEHKNTKIHQRNGPLNREFLDFRLAENLRFRDHYVVLARTRTLAVMHARNSNFVCNILHIITWSTLPKGGRGAKHSPSSS